MKKIKHLTDNGFTLMEILITLAILGVVGSLVTGVFFTTLRATNKSNTIIIVRENGNNALTQMTKVIRFASSFNGVSSGGNTYSPDCTGSAGVSYTDIKVTTVTEGLVKFSCTSAVAPNTISQNDVSLIDTTQVSLASCSITCTQTNQYTPQTIGIQFVLQQKNATPLSENQASIPFQTTVTFRNIQR